MLSCQIETRRIVVRFLLAPFNSLPEQGFAPGSEPWNRSNELSHFFHLLLIFRFEVFAVMVKLPFYQFWLCMVHHERVSINPPPQSEACSDFKLEAHTRNKESTLMVLLAQCSTTELSRFPVVTIG